MHSDSDGLSVIRLVLSIIHPGVVSLMFKHRQFAGFLLRPKMVEKYERQNKKHFNQATDVCMAGGC